ncbi:unnamed protein product, partial [Brachionus calyciflorus]
MITDGLIGIKQRKIRLINFDDELDGKEGKMPESCLPIPSDPERGSDKPKVQFALQ